MAEASAPRAVEAGAPRADETGLPRMARTAAPRADEPTAPGAGRTAASHAGEPGAPGAGEAGVPLTGALMTMRTAVAEARFPLAVASAPDARSVAKRITGHLDNYLLSRMEHLSAPLLAVVGGSTGAGKSTLVNSIVRAPVTAAGVLRPTTRAPVLVSHPADSGWFTGRQILPGFTGSSTVRTDHVGIQVLSAPALTPGLALLDAPDIDSIVDANRDLAAQLLAAADLWLFVTTAARYADAVPWQVLRTARDRGTVLALVLDRVPPGAEDEISAHLRDMLRTQRLDDVPLFVIDESTVDGSGLLPELLVAPVHDWLATLAADASARAAVVRTTVEGAIRAVVTDANTLAHAADQQVHAWYALDRMVRTSYRRASHLVGQALLDGALLWGGALTRWQDFVGTGDLARALRARAARPRDSIATAATRPLPPGGELRDALTSGLAAMIEAAASDAAERTAKLWRGTPAGAELVTDALLRGSPDLAGRAQRLVRDWQQGVAALVRDEGSSKRRMGRSTAYTIDATGLLVTIGAVAPTAFVPTGAEIAIAGGASGTVHKLLAAACRDEALGQLARTARDDLLERVRALLDIEAARFTSVRSAIGLEPDLPQRLRITARSVERAVPATSRS